MEDKLSQKLVFVSSYTPYDFTRNMGQYAVRVNYTNGDYDMLTTKSTKPNVYDKGDFKDEREFFDFLTWLDKNNVVNKKDEE